jgi:polysaccharide biosynthesis/export protein
MWCRGRNLPGCRCLSETSLLAVVVVLSSIISMGQANASSPDASASGTSVASIKAGSTETSTAASTGIDSSNVRLGPGDLVEMNVYGVPELSTKARVSNAGDLYLPLVDYVHVGSLTLEEAQILIQKRLADGGFLKGPHVSLFIDEYASQAVTLLGEVARPGVYPIVGDRRLFDLVSSAGGFTDKSGKVVTISHRNSPDKAITVRLPQHLEQGASTNVDVLPGDTVVVSRAGIVYVVGDVGRPSGFLMESDSITVLQAIAMAGGANKTAKLNGARLIRKASGGMQETPLPLKKILQAKTADLPMQADDILFVPSSTGKSVMYRSAEAVVQAATALTIVGAHP